MSILRVQIRQPNGQIDQLFIESDRVLIGSGAHCEIRLPVDQARVEHALIQMGPTGVFVQALSFEPPPTVNNVPVTQGPLPPDAVLGVGQYQITVAVAEGAAPGQAIKKNENKSSPLTLILLVLCSGAALSLLFVDDKKIAASTVPTDAPELWGPPIAACPQRDRAQALALANERYAVADSKRERLPFHVQDGIAAVPLFELASACYAAAGERAASTESAKAAVTIRKELNDDYRTHRVRLEHNLATEDLEAARKEVIILLRFTEGKQGDYVTWLANLDRSLRIKLGRSSPS